MKKSVTFFLITLQATISTAQICNPLDPTFGTAGKSIGFTVGPNSSLNSSTVLTQPDGKIIQVADLAYYNGFTSTILVIRFNKNGSLDETFGTNGKAYLGFQYNNCYVSDAALQTDGKIIVTGINYNPNGESDIFLVRFKSDGNPDPGFGTNGQVFTALGNWSNVQSLALQPDGKIIVAGIFSGTANLCQVQPYYFAQGTILRYKSNGLIDSSFGQNGKIILSTGNYQDYTNVVAVQPDGKIVVAGTSFYACNCEVGYYGGLYWLCSASFLLVRRFNLDGSVDNTFGENGKVADSLVINEPSQLLLQTDGKIVITAASSEGFVVVRFNPDGSADSGFGSGGRSVVTTTNNYLQTNVATIQPDGKIVLAGGLATGNYANFIVARLNTDGVPDISFNAKGIVTFQVGPPNSYEVATGVTIQDNKIVAGGRFYDGVKNSLTVVRLKELSLEPLGSIVTANGPTSFCDGGSVKLSTAATGEIQWYINNTVISGATGQIYTATSGGNYSVVTNNSGVCGISDTISVKVHPLPYAEIYWNGALNFCDGDSIVLNTPGAGTLQWFKDGNPLPGQTNASYSAKTSGSYQVSAVTGEGCTTMSSHVIVTVTSLDRPTITASGPLSFCEGGQVVLSAATVNTQWIRNGNPIPGATGSTFAVTSSGSYAVSNNCNVSDAVEVTVIAKPDKPQVDWNGIQVSTATGYASYQWSLDGVPITGATANTHNPGSANGIFVVHVTNADGCSNFSNGFNKVVTGVADITIGDTRLSYYPNPAAKVLYIGVTQPSGKKMLVELYDQLGRLLLSQSLNHLQNEIAVDGFAPGLYSLLIYVGKERTMRKIMLLK